MDSPPLRNLSVRLLNSTQNREKNQPTQSDGDRNSYVDPLVSLNGRAEKLNVKVRRCSLFSESLLSWFTI